MEVIGERTWITDDRGNRCSVEFWGDEAAARKALNSLYGCSGCSRCSDCSDCSGCSRCSRCSRCSDCSDMAPQNNVSQVPVIEGIHQKLLEAVTQNGCKLYMNTWHTCETAHCRAGWVVHLAGKPGYELEARTSTLFAAQQIYKASGYEISPNRFYDDDAKAMADMKRLAALEF